MEQDLCFLAFGCLYSSVGHYLSTHAGQRGNTDPFIYLSLKDLLSRLLHSSPVRATGRRLQAVCLLKATSQGGACLLGLNDELIILWWSQVKVGATSQNTAFGLFSVISIKTMVRDFLQIPLFLKDSPGNLKQGPPN